jgi:hypothetical protein
VELNDKKGDNITYIESTVQLEGDMQPSGTLPGSTGMVHNPEEAYQKYDCEDDNTEDKDNNPEHRKMELTQEDTRPSPKRNNK